MVINSFRDNFEKYKAENIAIYGTGEYAEWIVTNFKEYNILGFLDRWLSYGEMWGKPIFSYRDVLEKNITVIIIAASQYNTETVWRRIGKFCVDNGMSVFSLDGELLNHRGDCSANDESKNSNLGRYYECSQKIKTKQDVLHWELIECRFFSGNYIVDEKGRLYIKTAYDIGYLFLGPIMTDFLLWLVDKARNNECQNIAFAARDGFLLHRMYRHLQRVRREENLPKSYYLLTSRYVCMLSGLFEESDIIDCTKVNFEGDASLMLQKRFLLAESEIQEMDSERFADATEYILAHKEIILSKAEKIRNEYIKYLEQNGMREEGTLFFDLVASGTCQRSIEKLLDKHYVGGYLMRIPTEDAEKKKMCIFSYQEFEEEFATHSMFMESILTSMVPTLLYIDENQEPEFSKETRTKEELQFIEEAQNGIFDYFVEYLNKADREINEHEKNDIPTDIYNHVVSYYSIIENDVFNGYVIDDEIFNQKNSVLNKCIV